MKRNSIKRLSLRVALVALISSLGAINTNAQIGTEFIANASSPVYATYAPGDEDHLFVVELSGRIRVLDLNTNTYAAQPLLDVRGQIRTGFERGLLGMAFHPDFQNNGQFYINVSDNAFAGGTDHATYIREYTVNSGTLQANTATETTILRFSQPQGNHNGGWIDFSPNDGFLYIAVGDGGGGNDTGSGHTSGSGNAQDITNNLLGSMLRIDVDSDAFPADANRNYTVPASNPFVGVSGDDEIWAYGLRNPFRNSFDRATGDLYIADVGQGSREEIDFQPASSTGGENYGWRLREGTIATPAGGIGGPSPTGAIGPIHEYRHIGAPDGGNVVTGGYVYRGPVEEIQGDYFFADFGSDQIWSFEYDGTNLSDFQNRTSQVDPASGSITSVASFGEDAVGNLYILEIGGQIWRVTGPAVAGDFNRDAVIDGDDFTTWQAVYGTTAGASATSGDADSDGDVDGADFLIWQTGFGTDAANPNGSLLGANAVPEPATGLLCVCMLLVATGLRWFTSMKR